MEGILCGGGGWRYFEPLHYDVKCESFLSCLVADDELWCHHFEPYRKSTSMQWKHLDHQRTTKLNRIFLQVEFCLQHFLLRNGLLVDFKTGMLIRLSKISDLARCHGTVSWHGVMAWCHGIVSWHGVMVYCHGTVPWHGALRCNSVLYQCPPASLAGNISIE